VKKQSLFLLCALFFASPFLAFAEGSYDDEEYGEDYGGDSYGDDYSYDGYGEEETQDPVFEIVRSGSLEEIRSAVSDKVDSLGNTLLMAACESDREIEVLDYLIGAGARVNAKNFSGATPLMLACQNASPEAVRFLIQRGALTDLRDDDGRTALMYAAENGDLSVLGWLLSSGPAAFKKGAASLDESRRNALSYLCGNPSADAASVKALISAGCDVNARDTEGMIPLSLAVSSGVPSEAVSQLIAGGASVNSVDEYGSTPLLLACSNGAEPSVVKLLLSAGAKADAADDYGYTALLYSFYGDYAEELYPLLTRAGAKAGERGNDGVTALMMAAMYASAEFLSGLIADGAPVNALDDEGMSALMYACRDGDDDSALRILLDAGADTSPVDEYGKTAEDYAADNWSLEGSDQLERLQSPLKPL